MEIREFSERLLYGRQLADKLMRPLSLEDEAPGLAIGRVDAPGRPLGLEVSREVRAQGAFPALHELDQDRAHGRALLAFANHELMAIELMALVLLRFPEAPKEFRRGLAAIIQEEQTHFELYCDRASECGVELGEYPLNSFFWNCLSTVQSTIDATAAVSLTLEQANLDYASFYAAAFRKIGSHETAAILERVLEDEIRHLAHGVHWFRQWIGQSEDFFDAHAARLHLPMSMARAKGFEAGDRFVVEPRLRAGLSRDYVARMAAFRGSRGRPCAVFLFNPECEDEVRVGGERKSQRIMEDLQADLATLPAFLAAPEDIVLIQEAPSERFVASLDAAGFRMPRFLTEIPGGERDPHFSDLRPWGWSPVSQARLRGCLERLVARPRFFEGEWSPLLSEIHTKSFALPIAAAVRERCLEPWMIAREDLGARATDVAEANALVREWGGRGRAEVVLKAEFGSSGRNMIRIRGGKFEAPQERWLEEALAQHGAVVVEPWLNRVCDLSFRLKIEASGEACAREFGVSLTDQRGQYRGGFVGPLSRVIDAEVRRFLSGDGHDRHRVRRVMKVVAEEVALALKPSGYVGPVGVDALVFREANGELRLKPVVEINPRTTMGHVCAALEKHVAPGRVGVWLVLPLPALARVGFESLSAFGDFLRKAHPVHLSEGKIFAGALPTTDLSQARAFASVLFVGADLPELSAMAPLSRLAWLRPDPRP